eukprot:3329146-Prymnesium_polylepis.1
MLIHSDPRPSLLIPDPRASGRRIDSAGDASRRCATAKPHEISLRPRFPRLHSLTVTPSQLPPPPTLCVPRVQGRRYDSAFGEAAALTLFSRRPPHPPSPAASLGGQNGSSSRCVRCPRAVQPGAAPPCNWLARG